MQREFSLENYEEEIRKKDPDKSDAPYYIGERLHEITIQSELLKAASCSNGTAYMSQAMTRLQLPKSTAYAYRKYYRLYTKYSDYIRDQIGFYVDNDGEEIDFELGKVLMLGRILEDKKRSTEGDKDLWQHFLKDSYRDFKYYLNPSIKKEDEWKVKVKRWLKLYAEYRKNDYFVFYIYYNPETVDKEQLSNLVIESGRRYHDN